MNARFHHPLSNRALDTRPTLPGKPTESSLTLPLERGSAGQRAPSAGGGPASAGQRAPGAGGGRHWFTVAPLLLLAACSGGSSGNSDGSAHGDAALTDGSTTRGDAPPSLADRTLPVRDCTAYFAWNLGHQANAVAVAGDWNMFSTTADPMVDGLYSNTYRTALSLPTGSYGYKFYADGNWTLDPSNGMTRYVGGVENSRLDVPDCNAPLLRVDRAAVESNRTIALDIQYLDGVMRTGPDATSLTVTMNRQPVASTVTLDATTGKLTVRVPVPENNKYTFRIDVRDRGGHAAEQLVVPMWVEDQPFQWGDGPMYFTFTDRFRNGDTSIDRMVDGVDLRANYQGGDFRGITQALQEGYFDQLGVKVLWLSPVNDNTDNSGLGTGGHLYSAYHGYWVTKPRDTEERFGSLDDLRALTAEAHKHGIRVVLDIANNQLHREHPYFQMHPDWFNGDGSCVCGGTNCDWDTHALDCWFTNYLPDVNWTNMAAVDQMISDAIWWLEEVDADGFRVDAVKHMQHIASTTLRARVHQTLETGNARYYMVGETFTGGDQGGRDLIRSFLSDHELWGQFDFPLFWAIGSAFAANQGTMGDLDAAVSAGESTYGSAIMSPFLGNHDVERFLSRAANQLTGGDQPWTNPPSPPNDDTPYDSLFLAFTFLLGQPGVPLIYYGDEIGMPGAGDPDNRRMMRFGADVSPREQHLLDRVRLVAHARGTHPGLQRGARRTLHTDGDGYVFARGAGHDLAIVAINRGTTARSVHVNVPAELAADGTTMTDLLGGASITITGGGFDMPFTARNAALYVVQ